MIKRKRERRQALQRLQITKALAIECPTCHSAPGVWCFTMGILGPEMHQLRYDKANGEES